MQGAFLVWARRNTLGGESTVHLRRVRPLQPRLAYGVTGGGQDAVEA
jgi:hypothetical protein